MSCSWVLIIPSVDLWFIKMRARQPIIIIIHVATDQRMDGINTNWRQPPDDTWTGRAAVAVCFQLNTLSGREEVFAGVGSGMPLISKWTWLWAIVIKLMDRVLLILANSNANSAINYYYYWVSSQHLEYYAFASTFTFMYVSTPKAAYCCSCCYCSAFGIWWRCTKFIV